MGLKKFLTIASIMTVGVFIVFYYLYSIKNLAKDERPARVSEFNLEKFKVEHSDIFGGAYYDSSGSFTINIVDGTNIDNIPELNKNKVKINYVKYPLKNLQDIIGVLNNSKLDELGITSIELSEQENRVNIYIQNINEAKINKVKKICNSQAVQFKNVDSSMKVQF